MHDDDRSSWVALWRGINVGKAKRIAMADLRALLEEVGYDDVRTVLNSGNAVFRSGSQPDPVTAAAKVRAAVVDRLGVDAAVQLVDGAVWRRAIEANPMTELANGDPSRFLLHFLAAEPAPEIRSLAGQDWGRESVRLLGRVVYVHSPDGVLKSQAGKALARIVADGATARNWKTVLRIGELL